MAELSNQILHDLAQLRSLEAPSVAVKQRVLSAIEVQIGAGGGGDGGDGSGDGGGDPGSDLGSDLGQSIASGGGAAKVASAGYAAKVVGATLAMTGAGLLTLKVGAAGVQAAKARTQTEDAVVAVEPASAESSETPSNSNMPEPEPALTPVETTSDEPDAKPDERPPTSAKPKPSPATAPLAATPEDALTLELALLDAARGAASPKATLDSLERHLQDFPHGQLANERDIMRVETLCGLDRLDDARTIADDFLAANPKSSLTPRMRNACPKLF